MFRAIAAMLAASLLALGLSMGAALAAGDTHVPAQTAAKTQKGAHWAPSGVCLLNPSIRR